MTDKSTGVKSAYELALERLASQGIEPPRENALSAETKDRMAEIRRTAEAEIAKIEIMHGDRLRRADPALRAEAEEELQRERQRIVERRDRDLDAAREGD